MSEQTQRKYRMTDQSRLIDGVMAYRIQALRDIEINFDGHSRYVRAGQLGGYISNERNLSHEGLAWVADNACVLQHACVGGDALLEDQAKARNWATIQGSSRLHGTAMVGDRVNVTDVTLGKNEWRRQEDVQAYQQFLQDTNRFARANASRVARNAMAHVQPNQELQAYRAALQALEPTSNNSDTSVIDVIWTPQNVAAKTFCVRDIDELLQIKVQIEKALIDLRTNYLISSGARLRERVSALGALISQADVTVESIAEHLKFNAVLHKAGLTSDQFTALVRQDYIGPDVLVTSTNDKDK